MNDNVIAFEVRNFLTMYNYVSLKEILRELKEI